jgi:NADH-quinone oxidoreductase subunit H
MNLLISYLVFPGFLFSVSVGLLAGWLERKVTARLQWRVGPPWHQNFTDIVKLLGKEIIIPESGKWTFLLSPYLGLLSVTLVATILGNLLQSSIGSFNGDIIVVLYLMTIPAVATIIGASVSRNPLASVGASREMKLVLAYELPFIFSIITVIIKCGGVIQLSSILNHQANFGSHLASFSGILAFLVSMLCIQAKLCLVPFDASESEQELMGGVLIEYSGLPLAIFKLTKAMLLYTLPLFLIVLFWGQGLTLLVLVGKYAVLLAVIILIKSTNPRLRIDQALRFFWGPVTWAAVTAVILAIFGI